jgi:hypothetical protein
VTTRKLKLRLLTVVLIAVAALVIWQQQRARRLEMEAAALREQLGQTASLRAEIQRLTERLTKADERSEADKRELMRLRAQAGTLRQAEQENARLKAERDRLAQKDPQPRPQTADNPFDPQHGPGSGAKVNQAKHWGFALVLYAANHDGQFPASLDEAVAYLPDGLSEEEKARTKLAADQMTILYHGLRSDLDNLPPESTIILTEKQAWLDTQGRWAKTYVYSDGRAEVQTRSDGNFEKYESIRIPKPKGQ